MKDNEKRFTEKMEKIVPALSAERLEKLAQISELTAAILGVHAEVVAELEAKKSEERPGA